MLKFLVAAGLARSLTLATPVSSQTTTAPSRLPEIAGLSRARLANIANVLRADVERGSIPAARAEAIERVSAFLAR